MLNRQAYGVTLIEVLISVSFIAIMLAAIISLSVNANRLYLRTSGHIEPQASQMIALKRIERDLREGMFLLTTSSSTWVQVTLPALDDDGHHRIVQNSETGRLGLTPGVTVRYFLGTVQYTDSSKQHWLAIPSETGNILFRADASTVNGLGQYPDARVIIDSILSTPIIPNPVDPTQGTPTSIFTYWPANTDGSPTINTKLIKITLTKTAVEYLNTGKRTVNHTLWTQFCLRNLQTSQ
ncbi:MAG: PulJ/GspJ family protein [Armatimonadota bacterium]